MAGRVYITGFAQLKANLRNELGNMKFAGMEGMTEAADMIGKAMVTEIPTIPKDLGNLRKSWFIVNSAGVRRGKGGGFIGPDATELNAAHQGALAKAKTETKSASNVNVLMGFSSPYAIWAHEMPVGTQWSETGSGAKFFEKALKVKRTEILKIVQRAYLLKGFGKTAARKGMSYSKEFRSQQFISPT